MLEKLDTKDDRARAVQSERSEIRQKIEAQRQEFAQRQEILKGDHETLRTAVQTYIHA